MGKRYPKLSRAAINALAPGEGVSQDCISARRMASGDVRWSINVMVDGQRIHRRVGMEADGVRLGHCVALVEKIRTDAREGRLGIVGKKTMPVGFSAAADRYIKRLEDSGGKNLKVKRRHVKQVLKPYFKRQGLQRIGDFTLKQFVKARQDAGVANGTINRELATISHMFSMAREWGWIPRDHIPKIPRQDEGPGRQHTLSDDEATALFRASLDDQDRYAHVFVAYLLNSPMRHSEVLAGRYEYLRLAEHRQLIPDAKAGWRWQPLTAELCDLLAREREAAADPNGWIFPSLRPALSKAGHRTRMDRAFARCVARAGLDPKLVTPHTCRHTTCSLLVSSGVDLKTVQAISGHKTLAALMRYVHMSAPHVRAAAALLGRAPPRAVNDG